MGEKVQSSTLIRNKWGVISVSRSEKSNYRQGNNCIRLKTIRDNHKGESRDNLGKSIKHPGGTNQRPIGSLVARGNLQPEVLISE